MIKATPSLVQIRWEEQQGRCWICGCRMELHDRRSPRYRSIDHVLPLSRGGLNRPCNKLLACRQCNTDRGNALPEDEAAAERRVRYFLSRPQNYARLGRSIPKGSGIKKLWRTVIKSAHKHGEAEKAVADVFGPQRGLGRPWDE